MKKGSNLGSVSLVCSSCGKEFRKYKSVLKKKVTNDNFCTYKCYTDFRCAKTKNQDYFESISDESRAYWLGFLYADGSISKENRRQKSISVELKIGDKSHLEKFAFIFDKKCDLFTHKRKSIYNKYGHKCKKYTKSCRCYITSKKMWQDLYDKCFFPRKTYIDSDAIFDCIPENLKRHFIRGFFDGDGSVSINKKNNQSLIHMTSKRTKILQRIKEIIRDKVDLGDTKLIHRMPTDTYALAWSGVYQIIKIYNYFYESSTIFLERKKKRVLDAIKSRIPNYPQETEVVRKERKDKIKQYI
jgi:intein-encoded DNA endonuclease-like protein